MRSAFTGVGGSRGGTGTLSGLVMGGAPGIYGPGGTPGIYGPEGSFGSVVGLPGTRGTVGAGILGGLQIVQAGEVFPEGVLLPFKGVDPSG